MQVPSPGPDLFRISGVLVPTCLGHPLPPPRPPEPWKWLQSAAPPHPGEGKGSKRGSVISNCRLKITANEPKASGRSLGQNLNRNIKKKNYISNHNIWTIKKKIGILLT